MARPSYYPPSPPGVPADLTEPAASYKQQITLVLMALVLFFLFYFGLMFLAGLFVYFTWQLGWVFRILFAFPATLLFLFLLKNLFKRDRAEKTYDVEIFDDEHPRLFDFIDRLCDETGAPFPHRVLVNFEVNACVSYDMSFWHLFHPAKKDLKIGLGLVNAVNLTEFKALLAHEFGHISQKGTRLDAYVYTSLKIVAHLVYGRDFLDHFLEWWMRQDMVLAWPAWGLWGVLWLLRKLLHGLYIAIFYLNMGRSREMEFNADLFAVSVTGSDAPVHLLYKSVFGDHCLGQVVHELQMAYDHKLCSHDLFYHLDKAADFLRRKARDPRLGVPPALPEDPRQTTSVFKPDDDETAAMWAAHPSNFDREDNAKDYYIRSEFDERTPWILFDSIDELRERATWKFYRYCFRTPKDTDLRPPEEVQAFINEEHAETTYDPRYQGMYDHRHLMPGDIQAAVETARTLPREFAALAQEHAGLYSALVKHRAQLHNRRNEEYDELNAIRRGWKKCKNDAFDFRGDRWDRRDAKRLLRTLENELDEDRAWLADFDQRVFGIYYQLALQLDLAWARELVRRYTFHLELQKIWEKLLAHEGDVYGALDFLNNTVGTSLSYDDFQDLLAIFREAHQELKDALDNAEGMIIPDLKNMPAGEKLRPFLLPKKLIAKLRRGSSSLESQWLEKFMRQYTEVQKRINRLHFKSVGGILALQEQIGAEALRRVGAGNLPVREARKPPLSAM